MYKCQMFLPLLLPLVFAGHKQCAMLFRKYVSRTAAGSGRAVLEGVGLPFETIQMCYNSPQNEEEAIQCGLMKWRDGGGDRPTWSVLIEAMHYAKIGVQHIEAMKEELLKGAVCQLISQAYPLTMCVTEFLRAVLVVWCFESTTEWVVCYCIFSNSI